MSWAVVFEMRGGYDCQDSHPSQQPLFVYQGIRVVLKVLLEEG